MSLIHDDIPVRGSTKGTWALVINEVPPSGNVIKHMHWAVYSKLMDRWFFLVRCAKGFLDISRPTGKRWVLIIRHGKRPLDRDNLYTAMKPVVDILRPPSYKCGVHKSGKKKDQPWEKTRIGHGLILEDDEKVLELKAINGKLEKGQDPYTTIVISDSEEGIQFFLIVG